MIGKPILDVWFSRLAEPDEIRCDAMRCRCNQRNDIPPKVYDEVGFPYRKSATGASRFPASR
jgi:hypothetical protein